MRAVIGKHQADRETIVQEIVKHQNDLPLGLRPSTVRLWSSPSSPNYYASPSPFSLCASVRPFSLSGHRNLFIFFVGLPFPTAGIILTETTGLNRTTLDAALSSYGWLNESWCAVGPASSELGSDRQEMLFKQSRGDVLRENIGRVTCGERFLV